MRNLKSEYQFKQVAIELRKRLRLKDRSDELSQADIVQLFLEYSDIESKEILRTSAFRLHQALKILRANSKNRNVQHGQILQALSQALSNQSYQALKASLQPRTDFCKLFPEIKNTRST